MYIATTEITNNFIPFSAGRFYPFIHAVWSEAAIPKPSKLDAINLLLTVIISLSPSLSHSLSPSLPSSQVETVGSSLDLSHVFLLDAGNEIFIWCGTKSSLMSRSKARLIAEKMNKYERKNRARIVQFRAVSSIIILL